MYGVVKAVCQGIWSPRYSETIIPAPCSSSNPQHFLKRELGAAQAASSFEQMLVDACFIL